MEVFAQEHVGNQQYSHSCPTWEVCVSPALGGSARWQVSREKARGLAESDDGEDTETGWL